MTKPIYDMARERGQEQRIGELNPLQRGGEPEEIAQAALVPRFGRSQLRQRHGASRRWRPVEQPSDARRFDIRMLDVPS